MILRNKFLYQIWSYVDKKEKLNRDFHFLFIHIFLYCTYRIKKGSREKILKKVNERIK